MLCGLQDLPSFTLVRGVGNYSDNKACVMSAAVACHRLSRGEPLGEATDKMECCCPVIRAFLINLNDSPMWRDDAHRTETLLPFVPRLAGTRNDKLMQRRAFILADWAVRTVTADAMDVAGLPEQAKSIRELAEIVDQASARDAADADAAALAAALAAAAADTSVTSAAAAYAAAAADAAYTCAYAAYTSAAYTSAAVAAAYAAAHAVAAKTKIIESCVTVLNRLISLSE